MLVASSEGSLQLWNIRTKYVPRTRRLTVSDFELHRACIHTFPAASLLTTPQLIHDGSGPAITALAQSPAIDVVGLGFATGEISVYDVRMEERLLRMSIQDGAVRALSFRTGKILEYLSSVDAMKNYQMVSQSLLRVPLLVTSHFGILITVVDYFTLSVGLMMVL